MTGRLRVYVCYVRIRRQTPGESFVRTRQSTAYGSVEASAKVYAYGITLHYFPYPIQN